MQLKSGDFLVWVRGPYKGLFGCVLQPSWDSRFVVLAEDGLFHWAPSSDIVIANDDFEQWAIVERVKAGCYD